MKAAAKKVINPDTLPKSFKTEEEFERNVQEALAELYKDRKTPPDPRMKPPEGFVTGDEFEIRVKMRVTQLYRDHGLL
jgi:hypothetical protein